LAKCWRDFAGAVIIGNALPGVFQFVFPESSLGALKMLSQVGIILFMFVVGMELDGGICGAGPTRRCW